MPGTMRVAITGSSGLIGSALARSLEADGHEVVRVVRSGGSGPGRVRWDIERGEIDEVEVAWTDQLGHAAGKRIPARGFLERARGEGFAFSKGQLSWNSVAEIQDNLEFASWDTGYEDVYAVPDLATARPLPWRDRVAHVTADIRDHHGEPVTVFGPGGARRVVQPSPNADRT